MLSEAFIPSGPFFPLLRTAGGSRRSICLLVDSTPPLTLAIRAAQDSCQAEATRMGYHHALNRGVDHVNKVLAMLEAHEEQAEVGGGPEEVGAWRMGI